MLWSVWVAQTGNFDAQVLRNLFYEKFKLIIFLYQVVQKMNFYTSVKYVFIQYNNLLLELLLWTVKNIKVMPK